MSDGWRSALYLLFALFLVFLNGFFVAAEFSLIRVRATRLEELAAKKRFGAQKALGAVRHLNAYLSATQLGITLASLGLGYVGEPAFAQLLGPLFGGIEHLFHTHISGGIERSLSAVIAFLVITVLQIVLGELAPKSLAIQRSEAIVLGIIYPLDFFYRLFRLPIAGMNRVAAGILSLLGIGTVNEHVDEAHSEEELRIIISASREGGEIKDTEHSLINRVFDFSHRQAKDVMVPRPDVVFLSTRKTVAQNADFAEANGFTRYPLCEDDSPDDVTGMIHVKDLLALTHRRPVPAVGASELTDAEQLRRIARTMRRIPETRPIDALLKDLQRERQHMAVVVDEYGGTAGIVTVEDIVEEIVGDIQDEFDRTSPEMEPVGTDCYLVDARMPLDKLRRTLDLLSPEEETDVDTVGGWILASRTGGGSVPVRIGDTLAYGTARFTVAEMTGRRIRKVKICVPERGREDEASVDPEKPRAEENVAGG